MCEERVKLADAIVAAYQHLHVMQELEAQHVMDGDREDVQRLEAVIKDATERFDAAVDAFKAHIAEHRCEGPKSTGASG